MNVRVTGDEKVQVGITLRGQKVVVDVQVREAETCDRVKDPTYPTRIHVDLDDTEAARQRDELFPKDAEGNLNYTVRGADPEVDRAWDRGNREYVLIGTELIKAVGAVWDADLKPKFSRKGGCSCGCSPAWIIDDDHGHDIWLTAREACDTDDVARGRAYAPTVDSMFEHPDTSDSRDTDDGDGDDDVM